MLTDEELSATSHEEAGKVLEQWRTDDCGQAAIDMMDVDAQLGTSYQEEAVFHDACASPTGPIEEFAYMSFHGDDADRLSLELLVFNEDAEGSTGPLPFEERYKATLRKLSESMKRSQETRKSLKIKTPKTEEYLRSSLVSGVVSSIEKSTNDLQVYLKTIHTA